MFSLFSRNVTGPQSAHRPVRRGATVAILGAVLAGTVTLAPAASADAAPTAPALSAAAPALLAAAAAAPPVLAPVTQDVSKLTAFDAEILRLTNVKRTEAGLVVLQEARGLSSLSGWWSGQEAASGQLDSNDAGMAMLADYGAPSRTMWGENVVRFTTSRVTAQNVFDAYWASPTHKANLLNPAYRFVGLGSSAAAADASYSTMNFADRVDAGQTYDPRAAATPIGHFQYATLDGATVSLSGWALDPDITTAASTISITDTAADGTVVTKSASANVNRAEVAQQYPTSGGNHGFDYSYVTSGRGAHNVCVTVVNTGAGLGNVALGCLDYQVGNPVGLFYSAAVTGTTLAVSGWAVDPDQPTAAATVTVTDKLGSAVTTTKLVADKVSADSATQVPGAGANHQFSGTAAITGVGNHTVCATVAGIRNAAVVTDLGCKTVTIVGAAKPVGSFDALTTPTDTSVTVAGWAADPDFPTAASTVTVKITNAAGTTASTVTAGGTYPTEVAAGLGRNHAFSATLPLTTDGVSTVCVTAVSRTTATTVTDLGCKTVTENWLMGWQDKVTPTTDAKNVRTLAVKGWAIDGGNLTATTTVKIAVTAPNGATTTTTVAANALRADVGAAHPGAGDNHGFLSTITVAAAGSYKVCSTEVSSRSADVTLSLGCTTVTVK